MFDARSLHDLMALIHCRNITEAARRRHVSQPAFSRRLQSIEAAHAVALVDRSTRPAGPSPALDAARGEIESALEALARVERRLARSGGDDGETLVATTHSLASGLLADALSTLARDDVGSARTRVRIHSANVHECCRMLMTEEVPLLLCYESASQRLRIPDDFVDKTRIAVDALIPVCAVALHGTIAAAVPGGERIPLVAYPDDIFLGRVLFEEILPRTAHEFRRTLVTDFTSATLASVRAGAGMAWLPRTIVEKVVASGELAVLEGERFPAAELHVVMFSLRGKDARGVPARADIAARIEKAVRDATAG